MHFLRKNCGDEEVTKLLVTGTSPYYSVDLEYVKDYYFTWEHGAQLG